MCYGAVPSKELMTPPLDTISTNGVYTMSLQTQVQCCVLCSHFKVSYYLDELVPSKSITVNWRTISFSLITLAMVENAKEDQQLLWLQMAMAINKLVEKLNMWQHEKNTILIHAKEKKCFRTCVFVLSSFVSMKWLYDSEELFEIGPKSFVSWSVKWRHKYIQLTLYLNILAAASPQG